MNDLFTAAIDSPVGPLEMATRGNTLVGLRFATSATSPADGDGSKPFQALAAYFDGDLMALDALDVEYDGTPFQTAVWRALRDIPVGAVASYADIAAAVGRPLAARAVGQANHVNRIAIVIPCHRVVAAGGKLGGYGAGLPRKEWLLRHEGFEFDGLVSGLPGPRLRRPRRQAS